MPKERHRRIENYRHEQTWLRSFVEFHGMENTIRFNDDDLGGVSLVRVMEALTLGTVLSAEKCDEPGTICVVFYSSDDDVSVFVKVHFISNEYVLTILSARETRGYRYEPHQCA